MFWLSSLNFRLRLAAFVVCASWAGCGGERGLFVPY
jgi:hypothetical protein